MQRARERLTRQADKCGTKTARVVSGFVGRARREFGRQMFEKEQIQIKPWRETCDRAGRGRAGIADKEQEGRKKRTKGWWWWWESEVSHSHRRRVPWVSSLVPLVPLGSLELSIRCRAKRSMVEPRHGHRRNKRGGSAGSGSGHEAWVGKVMWWDTARGGADSGRHDVVGRGVMVGSLGAAALSMLSETSDSGV